MTLEQIILEHYKLPFTSESYINYENFCFICGQKNTTNTKEDLFPKWFLKDLNLYQERIILPNDSLIQFNKMTIPCCRICNNEYLSQIEQKVKLVFNKESKNVTEEERHLLFKWLLKIFGGIWLKSTTLKSDISKNDSESIIAKNYLKSISLVYSLAKTIRYDVTFTNYKPYSIFLFDVDFNGDDISFYFLDNFNFPTIAFAYKRIGLILAIGDDGEIRNRFTQMGELEFSLVNHISFIQNFCRVLTVHSLMNTVFGYLSVQNRISKELRISNYIIPGRENADVLKPWDKQVYKKLLISYLNKLGFTVTIDDENESISYTKN